MSTVVSKRGEVHFMLALTHPNGIWSVIPVSFTEAVQSAPIHIRDGKVVSLDHDMTQAKATAPNTSGRVAVYEALSPSGTQVVNGVAYNFAWPSKTATEQVYVPSPACLELEASFVKLHKQVADIAEMLGAAMTIRECMSMEDRVLASDAPVFRLSMYRRCLDRWLGLPTVAYPWPISDSEKDRLALELVAKAPGLIVQGARREALSRSAAPAAENISVPAENHDEQSYSRPPGKQKREPRSRRAKAMSKSSGRQ